MIETLIKALELMQDGSKWTKDLRFGGRDCYCVYTALIEAHRRTIGATGDKGFTSVELGCNPAGAERLTRAAGLSKLTDLFSWNDLPSRTWDDVKRLFNDAIELYTPPAHEDEDGG